MRFKLCIFSVLVLVLMLGLFAPVWVFTPVIRSADGYMEARDMWSGEFRRNVVYNLASRREFFIYFKGRVFVTYSTYSDKDVVAKITMLSVDAMRQNEPEDKRLGD